MKIKIKNTCDAFDPAATAADYNASLKSYETALTAEILKAYPEAEIEYYRSNDEYGAPANARAVTGTDDPAADEDEIQRIEELVYTTGLFWI